MFDAQAAVHHVDRPEGARQHPVVRLPERPLPRKAPRVVGNREGPGGKAFVRVLVLQPELGGLDPHPAIGLVDRNPGLPRNPFTDAKGRGVEKLARGRVLRPDQVRPEDGEPGVPVANDGGGFLVHAQW